MKSTALLELQRLAVAEAKLKYPGWPESHYTGTRKFNDKTANELTKAVITWVRLHGYQAERINSTGRLLDQRKTFTDVIGRQRTIGSKKWIFTSGQRGTADISATIQGRSVKIEIKAGHDRQSEIQKKYQASVEAAGGVYLIVKDFQSFYDWFQNFIKTIKKPGGGRATIKNEQ